MGERRSKIDSYMEKKIRLLYIQTAVSVVQVLCLLGLILWAVFE